MFLSPLLQFTHKVFTHVSVAIRSTYYRRLFCRCGKNLHVYGHIRVDEPQRVVIGSDCILSECIFIAHAQIHIGDRARISPQVVITTAGLHKLPNAKEGRTHFEKEIFIGDDVWIGTGATILPGVSIGDGAIIGAGAVVTHDVPPWAVAVGLPAYVRGSVKDDGTGPAGLDEAKSE